MKIILTGCTGFIGGEVLSQCLRNSSVTSVVTLSRRKLPESISGNGKLKTVIVEDFNVYTDSTLKELAGADACIWCMGNTRGDKALEVDYPLAFARAFTSTLSSTNKNFRYIHLSGATTERDQSKPLWFKNEMRKMKGQTETTMLSFPTNEETKGLWETLIVKPGYVLRAGTSKLLVDWVMGTKYTIRVDELAAVLVDAAMNGRKESTLDDTHAMVMRGREVRPRVL